MALFVVVAAILPAVWVAMIQFIKSQNPHDFPNGLDYSLMMVTCLIATLVWRFFRRSCAHARTRVKFNFNQPKDDNLGTESDTDADTDTDTDTDTDAENDATSHTDTDPVRTNPAAIPKRHRHVATLCMKTWHIHCYVPQNSTVTGQVVENATTISSASASSDFRLLYSVSGFQCRSHANAFRKMINHRCKPHTGSISEEQQVVRVQRLVDRHSRPLELRVNVE